MAQQNINIGPHPNSPIADNLWQAFNKCNQNFTELYRGIFGYVTAAVLNSYFNSPTTNPGWNAMAWQSAIGIVPGTISLAYVGAPSNFTDFSTLPGGVAPTGPVAFMAMDMNYLWSIKGGETEWQQSTRSN